LEMQDDERLDDRATVATSAANPQLAAVVAIDGR